MLSNYLYRFILHKHIHILGNRYILTFNTVFLRWTPLTDTVELKTSSAYVHRPGGINPICTYATWELKSLMQSSLNYREDSQLLQWSLDQSLNELLCTESWKLTWNLSKADDLPMMIISFSTHISLFIFKAFQYIKLYKSDIEMNLHLHFFTATNEFIFYLFLLTEIYTTSISASSV